jgi:hypothetical protein
MTRANSKPIPILPFPLKGKELNFNISQRVFPPP